MQEMQSPGKGICPSRSDVGEGLDPPLYSYAQSLLGGSRPSPTKITGMTGRQLFTGIDGLHKPLQVGLCPPVDRDKFSTLSTGFSTG